MPPPYRPVPVVLEPPRAWAPGLTERWQASPPVEDPPRPWPDPLRTVLDPFAVAFTRSLRHFGEGGAWQLAQAPWQALALPYLLQRDSARNPPPFANAPEPRPDAEREQGR